ncbi:MAG: OmpA family protein [Planctomycetaceae bacterium]|jgi:flagellar motor protein MotB|nr:OmpA family protein [Planctomycetaceae bacterium]
MFGLFPNNRMACVYIAGLLCAALVAPAGCRCFSPKTQRSPAPSPVSAPQTTVPETHAAGSLSPQVSSPPVSYTTYRPPLPNEILQKEVPQKTVIQEKASAAEQVPSISRSDVLPQTPAVRTDAEIERLQSEVNALKEKLRQAERSTPAPAEPALPNLMPEPPKTLQNASAEIPKLPAINKQGVTVSLDEQKRTHIAVVDSVLFMPNTHQLTAEGEETLRTIAAELKASQPKMVLEIEGHTDSLIGDPKNALQKHDISSIKSMAVMEFFINALKWDASSIRTSSYGRSRPAADNGTPEGRAKNNRIELVVQ